MLVFIVNFFRVLLFIFISFVASGYADQASLGSVFSHPLVGKKTADFAVVQHQLASINKLSGQFKQTRWIRLLTKPLVSTGRFVLSKQAGLHWQQESPFSSVLDLTDNRLVATMLNNPPTVITKEKQPVVFSFTNIFLSIFKGNSDSLTHNFKIYFTGNKNHWTMGLLPRSPLLAKAISRIILTGGQYVRRVYIEQAKGDHLEIVFSHLDNQTTTISKEAVSS